MHNHTVSLRAAPSCSNSNRFAQYVIKRVVDQAIVNKAIKNCIPKEIVYRDGCHNAEQIQNSVVAVTLAKPDMLATRMSQSQDFDRSPTSFKVKRKFINATAQMKNGSKTSLVWSKGSNNNIPDMMCQNGNSLKRLQIQRYKSDQGQQPRSFVRLQNRKTTHSHFPQKRSSRRMSRDHHISSMKLSRKQILQNDDEDQIIRQYRQEIFNRDKYPQSSDIAQNIKKQNDKNQMKKTGKQNQMKKFFSQTTDYNGFIIPLSKADANRNIAHYIDVAYEIQQNEERPQPKKHLPSLCYNYNQSQFLHEDYKQLKAIEKKSNFIINVMKKVEKFQMKDKDNSIDSFDGGKIKGEQQEEIAQIKFTGKTLKPTKVGFHLFQKMKKSNWKKENIKQNFANQNESPVLEIQKTKSQQKTGSQKSQFSKQSQKTLKKSMTITLGNQHAVNYLINQDCKIYKKKVTINSQFL